MAAMMFKCPSCGKQYDFLEIQMESDLHAIIQMLPAFGRHANIVTGYCYLFGISPLKFKAKKWRKLLEELKVLFELEEFSYQKRRYRISRDGIAEALNIVVKKNFAAGLDSHNYLKKVMINISDREEHDRSIKAEADLRRKEAILGAGRHETDEEPDPRGGEIPPEAKAEIAKMFGPDKVL